MAVQRGSNNRNKKFLLSRLKDMYGDKFDPIMSIAKNCVRAQSALDNTNEEEDTLDIIEHIKPVNEQWEKLARYCYPQLKAIEMQVESKDPIQELSRDLLLERLRKLEESTYGSTTGGGSDKGGDI